MNLPFKIICYINGILFYPAGVTYNAADGEHAMFTLTMPAVPHWSILPERSHAAVFYTDPVSNSWRMLCEGDYIGNSRQRAAVGTRYRSLAFRSTHAMWETTSFAGMCGLASGDIGQQSAANQIQTSQASGIEVRTTPNSLLDLARTNLWGLMSNYVSTGTVMSAFLPNFVNGAMQQVPVDAFYSVARRVADKMFSLYDQDIGGVVTTELVTQLIRQNWSPQALGANTTLETIIRSIENLTMYRHVTIPSPPLYINQEATTPEGFTIGELLFLPHLYSAVPPACNVIFKDQITNIAGGRNFLAEPTRVIVQLSSKINSGNQNLPLFIMSNDVERSVSIGSINNASKVNQTNDGAAPGTLVIHDFLTQEEYHRGVIPQVISLPIQNLTTRLKDENSPTSQATSDPKETNRIIDYASHTARHYYEVARGANRTMSVSTTFLPYAVPGFPCIIEDDDGSFWGMIRSVTHTLTPTQQPSTQLEISHVREAYIVDGTFRNAYNPVWLNRAFLPTNINDTYAKLFGTNAPDAQRAGPGLGAHAAMVPSSIITSVGLSQTAIPLNAKDQVNMDELAAYVIPIQRYTKDGRLVALDTSGTVAEKIRRTGDAQLNCLKFQYRAGITLTQFAKFHKLTGIGANADGTTGGITSPNNTDYVFSQQPPPVDLADGKPHLLFGTPVRMIFEGQEAQRKGSLYGVYTLQKDGINDITYIRQQAALTIKAAIDKIITKD